MERLRDIWQRRGAGFTTLIRYGLVGVGQNGLGYAALLGLIFLGLKAWQATIIVYPIAATISFLAHRSISFRVAAAPRQRARFAVVYAAMYLFAVGFAWLQEHLGVPGWAASLTTMVCAAVIMFALLRWWVFRATRG